MKKTLCIITLLISLCLISLAYYSYSNQFTGEGGCQKTCSEGCKKDCKEHTKSEDEFQNCYKECIEYRDPYLMDVDFKCDDTGCREVSTMPKPSRYR